MPEPQQSLRQRPADHAGAQDHHAQALAWLGRAFASGSLASVLSTVAVSVFSRHRSGAAVAGTNASSQWFWYPRARHVDAPSLRYTLGGYAVHHASSVFWACAYEATAPRTAGTAGRAGRAAAVAALAYLVDYHVVPRRLSPGFEHRIGPPGMVATYGAFGLGLFLAARRRRQRALVGCPSSPTSDQVPHWSTTPSPAVRSAPASPA